MHKFDYSFLENIMLPASLFQLIESVSALKATQNQQEEVYKPIFTDLEAMAKVQSVKASNAIEGIITSDERIRSIVNHSTAPLNHDESEIAGYRDVLALIHTDYPVLSLQESTILNLHKLLLSVAAYEFAGQYKKEDNVIMEINQAGERRVRFQPTPALLTPETMNQWVLAYIEARDNPHISPLLLIPCVILDFLCIHPFRDGNGRMSRLLTLLLLYKNGFTIGKYISFEEQINKEKDAYYQALKDSSAGWNENTNSYLPFIQNFLITLHACYRELEKRLSVVRNKKVTAAQRVESVLQAADGPLSKAKICQRIEAVSPTTIEAALGKLVRQGKIHKIGSGRRTQYKVNLNK